MVERAFHGLTLLLSVLALVKARTKEKEIVFIKQCEL